jgi:hypothetical protein
VSRVNQWGAQASPRLRRIYANLAAAVAATALVALAFADIAFGGRTFSTAWETVGTNGFLPPVGSGTIPIPVDQYRLDLGASAWQFEPWAQIVHRVMAHGEWPLWNPYQGGGAPLAANMSSGVFDPLMLLVHLHPSLRVWDLTIMLWLIAGVWLAFVYMRSLDFGAAAAFAGATTFGLSGFFFLFSNNQFFRSYLYMPIALLLVDKVIRSDRLRWIGLLGAAVAGNLLVGMPESSLAVLSLTGAYALFRLATFAEAGQRIRGSLRLAAGGALGLCLAAPLLLLFFQYASIAQTSHAPGAGVGLWADPARLLLLWAVPLADGHQLAGVLGGFSGVRDWIGAAAVMAAVVGISSGREMWRRPGAFFAVVAALVLLKMYGFAVVQWAGLLPAASQEDFPRYFPPAVAFSLAVLAAAGIQAIADGSWIKWRLLSGLAAVAVVGVWLVNGNRAELAASPPTDVISHYGLAVVAALAVLLACVGHPRKRYQWVATAAVIGELLLLAPHGIYAPRLDPYRPPAWLGAAGYSAQGSTDRVYAFDAKLFPNIAGAYQMQDIRALDALYPIRYVKYITTFIQPDFGTRFVGGAYSQQEGGKPAHIAGNPMVDLLGVRYLIAGQKSPDDLSLRSVAGSGAPKPLRLVASSEGTNVYENEERLPRAFVAHNLTYVADMDAAVRAFGATGPKYPDGAVQVSAFNPRADAIVEASPPRTKGSTPCNGSSDAASITSYSSEQVSIDVTSTCGGLLVLSDVYYPGWDAIVNGRQAAILPTDILLRGVPVDAGHSVVTFQYRPANFGLGLLLAASAVAILAATGAWRRIRPRLRGDRVTDPNQP